MKQCSKCKELKEEHRFSKSKETKDGLRWNCKDCDHLPRKIPSVIPDKKICKQCLLEKPSNEFYKKARKIDGLNSKCILCCRENSKKYNKAEHRRRYFFGLVYKYNINKEQYQQMQKEQDNKCYICNVYDERLCVDHNHTTNKVRKLLCKKCNSGIAMFGEDTDLLDKAIKYIKEFNEVCLPT